MQKYYIKNSHLTGEIQASASKSHSMRAILFAALAHGTSNIFNYLDSPDINAMLQAVELMGAKVIKTLNKLEITGFNGSPKTPKDIIDAKNSGQVLRFIGAIAALTEGYTVITGDHSIRTNRPIAPLIDGLQQLGVTAASTKFDNFAPIIVKGLATHNYANIDGEDSQPVSALLILSAFLPFSEVTLKVNNSGEKPWVNLTIGWLQKFGISVINDNFNYYRIPGNNKIFGFDYEVPGDWSSMLYPIVAALLTQSNIQINNLDSNDLQGDKNVINFLKELGANIYYKNNNLIIDGINNKFKVINNLELDVNEFIDAIPILAVLGCFLEGTLTLKNAGIARNKESDRLNTITIELKKMGANIAETRDSLIISKSKLHFSNDLQSHDDHRIALALSIAAMTIKETSCIQNVGCINKSYINFFKDMNDLKAKIVYG